MDILNTHQFALLEGVRRGQYSGSAPLEELRPEIDLMLELRIIEPSGACPYRLTSIGVRVLAAAVAHSMP